MSQLLRSTTLRTLSLAGNEIATVTYDTLSQAYGKTKHVYDNTKTAGDASGLAALAAALQGNSTLTHLDLSSTGLGKASREAQLLLDAVAGSAVRTVTLSGNGFKGSSSVGDISEDWITKRLGDRAEGHAHVKRPRY